MDFQRISASSEIHIRIPLHFRERGRLRRQESRRDRDPPARRGGGGLPAEGIFPEYVEVDMSALDIGESVHLSELALPEGVRLLALAQNPDNDPPIVSVQHPQKLAGEGEAPAEEDASEAQASRDRAKADPARPLGCALPAFHRARQSRGPLRGDPPQRGRVAARPCGPALRLQDSGRWPAASERWRMPRSGGRGVRLFRPGTIHERQRQGSGGGSRVLQGPGRADPHRAHDEIDPAGRHGAPEARPGGHGGHNGLRDVVPCLGGSGFSRIRIGVGASREQGAGHRPRPRPPATGRARRDRPGRLERVMEDVERIVEGDLEGRDEHLAPERRPQRRSAARSPLTPRGSARAPDYDPLWNCRRSASTRAGSRRSPE